MLTLNETDKLLMIPGPTPVQREILTALGEPTISHTSAALADIIRDVQAGLRVVAGTENGTVFVFGGSGTLAQEAAVVNLVAPGERLLVASNGYFGDRFRLIAEAHGIEVEYLGAPWGRSITPDELEARLAQGKVRAVTITHVETSTGTAAPVPALIEVAKRHGTLVILDTVCSLGGMPVLMDEWGIDVVVSGAQKALGVPPGLTILIVSEAAMNRRRELDRVPAYYADLLNWEASMANPQVYFSTHAVNLFYALLASLEIIKREGLEDRFSRHERLAEAFRAGMRTLGFEPLTDERDLAPTLSVLAYPAGIEDESFRAELSRHDVVAAGCLGEFKGRGLRFGHMGNITSTEIFQALAAAEIAAQSAGGATAGAAVAAAQQALLPQEVAI